MNSQQSDSVAKDLIINPTKVEQDVPVAKPVSAEIPVENTK